MKQQIVRIAIGLAVLLLFVGHAAKFYQISLVSQLDSIIYDTRLRLTMPDSVDTRIVILDIDEKSLAEVGRWPWGRDRVSELIKKLFDKYGLVMVGFDVVFAEADSSSGLPVLESLAKKEFKDNAQFQSILGQLRPMLDHDAMFAQTIKGRPVVLGYYFNSADDARESGGIPAPVIPAGAFAGKNIAFTSWKGFGGNLQEFQKNAASAGHFNPLVDFDGVSRRVPMLAEYKGAYYESLSLSMIRTLLALGSGQFPDVVPGYPPDRVISSGYAGLEWLEVGPLKIPVDENVSALIPYRGKQGSFQYFSLADVMSDRLPVETLKGKIALIGTSAPGLLDLRSTPVGSVYPGVEIHANLIAGMLDSSIKQRPPFMLGAEVILLLIGGITLSLLMPMLSPLRATLVSILAMLLITGINVLIWSGAGMVLSLASSLLLTMGLFILNMAYGYFVESRSKRQFTELFGQYVPPELVDKMAQDPEKYSMEGKREDLTVLFSDIRGFTTISESLDPHELSAYINEYLTTMSLIIRNNHGTLDKYIGDAIMAFWGAPVADPAHHRNGVITALQMQEKATALNEEFRKRGWPEIKIGVGLNSGVMSVGDMGSKVRKAYTVMGDPVNLGSRLEGITKQYGVGILVGESTKRAVTDIVFREVDRVRVKGKEEPVAIFEPIGVDGQVDKNMLDEIELWHQCLGAYRAQDWDQAELQLVNLHQLNPTLGLYRIFSEKISECRANPPGPDWDGVTKFETK